MKLDTVGGQLAIEERSEEELEVRYHMLDLSTNRLMKIPSPKNTDWWSSLAAIYGDLILISDFGDQQNPGPADLVIFNFIKQEVLRKEKDVLISEILSGTLRGYQFRDDHKDPLTIDLNEYTRAGNDASFFPAYPTLFTEDSKEFETIRQFLRRKGTVPVLGAEYFEYEQHIFFSYFVKVDRRYDRFIIVLREGEVALHKKMDEGMSGMATESFFTLNGRLVFVENRRTLKIYEI